MPLLGQAAMLLSFDVAAEAIAEHDDWHTHEHLPERLAIPGFLRGTRWVALRGAPRYFVLYEVARLDVLTSDAYLQRLNNPTPWTSKIMPHYRAMSRGFCAVSGSFGFGLGHVAVLLRFKPPSAAAPTRAWLLGEVLPQLPAKPGIGSVHLLERALTPPMTNEQRIRGGDAGVDWAIVVTGYHEDAVASVNLSGLEQREAGDFLAATYRLDYCLLRDDL
jgi:hypothetical protein